MSFRKEEEKIFHDGLRRELLAQRWTPEVESIIMSNPLWVNMKYYSIERRSRAVVLDWLKKNCEGKRVLDYCCGNGEDSICIAKNGAKEVIGIDISELSIENSKRRARLENVQSTVKFYVMDGEALNFEDDYFDIITEYGSLHHLDLEKAFSEFVRVLKADGKAICTEALGHNKLIHWYRRATPHLRTKWEVDHILSKKDLELAKKFFKKEEKQFFHLTTLSAVPFRNSKAFSMLLSLTERIDNLLLRLPILRWQAWQVVFVLSGPIKLISIDRV